MRVSDLQGWGGRLVELAWELSDLGFDSVVRLPPGRRPSVEVFLPLGRPRPVTAQRGRTSTFTWPGSRNRRVRNQPGPIGPNPGCPERPDHDQAGDLRPDLTRRGRTGMREAAERIAEAAR
ncbi:hypothetical protein AB0B56_12525 [Streptosporangium canum]|uniref:hypothetical protein n=1 Tax=Streptosporangium canum TaxID=324952 RepID=UPI003428A810